MTYKIGDRVILKTKEQLLNSGWVYADFTHTLPGIWTAGIVPGMTEFLGQEFTIVGISRPSPLTYELSATTQYSWSPEMFLTDPLEVELRNMRKEIGI